MLRQLNKLLSTAKNAADVANQAKSRGENLRRIQQELSLLGVSGHVRCVYQGSLKLLSVVGAGAARASVSGTAQGGGQRRYYYFNNGLVVSEDDILVPVSGQGAAANLVRREFERVEDASGSTDATFKIVYKGGVVDIVQSVSKRDKDLWLKELHMTGVRGLLKRGSRGRSDEQALGEIWEKYDTNHDGFIGQDEFREALRAECSISNVDAADTIFRELDQNGDGKVTKEEFKNALVVHGGLRKAAPFRFPSLAPRCSWKTCCCLVLVGGMTTTLFFFYFLFTFFKGFMSQVDELDDWGNARGGGGVGGAPGVGEL